MADPVGDIDPLRLPPRILQANRYPFRKHEVVGGLYDESVLIAIIDEGRGVLRAHQDRLLLREGVVAYTPWAMPVRWEAGPDGMVATTIHLGFVPWEAAVAPLGDSRPADLARRSMVDRPPPHPWPEPFTLRDPGDIRELGRRVIDAWAEPGGRREPLLRALALELLEALRAARSAQARRQHPLAGPVLGLASWMEVHLSQRIARADLVARSGLDPTTLTEAFNQLVGRPPIDHLIDLRLRRARALLRTTRLPINEIGRRVGIPDPFYFSKLFRRKVGLSPRRYRGRRAL